MFKFLTNLFDSNEKQLNKIQPIVEQINGFEEEFSKLSDDELKKKTEEFRKRLNVDLTTARLEFETLKPEELSTKLDDEKKQLYEVLPEAFAVVREASKRVANHRHFDVQMTAGYVLFAFIPPTFAAARKTYSGFSF